MVLKIFQLPISSAVNMEQLVGYLWNILLLKNIIENPTTSWVLDLSVYIYFLEIIVFIDYAVMKFLYVILGEVWCLNRILNLICSDPWRLGIFFFRYNLIYVNTIVFYLFYKYNVFFSCMILLLIFYVFKA